MTGMEHLERKFLAEYGNTMAEHEYWWFVERYLEEYFEQEAKK